MFSLRNVPPGMFVPTRTLLLSLFGFVVSTCSHAREPDAVILSSALDVMSLSPLEASKGHAVRLEGVVVGHLREGALLVHDGSRTVYVIPLSSTAAGGIQRGSRVLVSGTTDPGQFAPMVRHAEFSVLGRGAIPPAQAVTMSDLSTGQCDGQWVEIEGVVRTASARRRWTGDTDLELAIGNERLPVVLEHIPIERAAPLIDTTVRLRGICFHFYNGKRQFYGAHIVVPAGEAPIVSTPAFADPFSLPLRSALSLLSYRIDGSNQHRVHLRGRVAYAKRGHFFYLADGTDGIQVKCRQANPAAVGRTVDVVGFAAHGRHGPILEDAVYRLTTADALAQTNIPPTQTINAKDALESDSEVIRLEGTLLHTFQSPEAQVLVIRSGDLVSHAHFPTDEDASAHRELEVGSRLALTGVCEVIMGAPEEDEWRWEPSSFRLLLRGAGDIVVLESPPWWNSNRRLRLALFALLGVVIGGTGWILRTRWKLRQQEAQRRASQVEFAAILKERSRMSREMHDTLAQSFTSISAQVELARQSLNQSPDATAEHLNLARTFVSMGLSEARRSIWALQPQILEKCDLVGAIEEVGTQLTIGAPIELRVIARGRVRRLAATLESDLLRIAQEAITNAVKHAQPTTIAVEAAFEEHVIRLRIVDDGRGFTALAPKTTRPTETGFGIPGMYKRAEQMAAQLDVQSTPAKGTEVKITVPLN